MSRDIPAAMALHIAGEVTSLALLWRIVRRDGAILGFTSHDRDLETEGLRWRAAPSFMPSALRTSADFEAGDIELSGALASGAISEGDLAAGRFDFARLTVSLINWASPGDGTIPLAAGTLGAVRWEDGAFRAELKTDGALLNNIVTEVYSPECRADLGDGRCRVDLAAHRTVVRVTAASSRTEFSAEGLEAAEDWYAYGRARWLTGENGGDECEIAGSSNGTIRLRQGARKIISPADLVEVTAGCDRRFGTCAGKFNNAMNFRGEPHVPGLDSMLSYPGAR